MTDDVKLPDPVAWMDRSGHPHHLRHVQGVRERQLYGPLQPLYDEPTVRRLIEEAKAEERERCAVLCDQMVDQQARYGEAEYSAGAAGCATAIRNRSKA